jgi:hypothetical protein
MASSALNCGLRAWLGRGGFPEDADVRKLEQLARSITHGMVMLLHILPRRPAKQNDSVQRYPNSLNGRSSRWRGELT